MKRFVILYAIVGACVLAAAQRGAAEDRQPAGKRLNVLFLMTDEQHFRSLSSTGNPYVTTPNMDRIGREGASLVNATCVTPYCSPSRASLITGVYPHRHGILVNVGGQGRQQPPLPPDAFPNTENLLHRQGYATAHFGKWHLGEPGEFGCYEPRTYFGKSNREYQELLDQRLPARQFAGFTGPGKYLGRPVEMIPAIEKAYRAFTTGPKIGVSYISIIGRSVIPPELLPETRITDEALRRIERHAREPFMITVSWSPPHDLWVIPEPYYSLVDRRKIQLPGSRALPAWDEKGPSKILGGLAGDEGLREYAAIYHGMVKYIDDQVGRILKRLDELGLAENTLVIFTTDHGDMVGAHGCIGKSVTGFYEDLVHIPLLMRLPGVIRPGTVVRRPVSQVDVMPTILDYLGQPIPQPIHGRSMRPLLEGRDVAWREHAFCQRGDKQYMLRTDRYKYVFGPAPRMLALYDLQADPEENRNLAGEPGSADLVRTMHGRLLEVMKADGATTVQTLPGDPFPAEEAGKAAEPVSWSPDALRHYRLAVGDKNDERFLQDWHGRGAGRKPCRWSKPVSRLLLPVLPGERYTVTLEAQIPPAAISAEAGLYLNGQKLAAFKAGNTLTAEMPPASNNEVQLELRTQGWVPQEQSPSSKDTRTLGIQAYTVTMRAANAGPVPFNANTGK